MTMPVTRAIRSERKLRADAMLAEYRALPLADKMNRLPPMPGAKKQRARLMAQLPK